VRKADNLPPSCADVKKSGGLNLLEPWGPVQACNGTALSLPFIIAFLFPCQQKCVLVHMYRAEIATYQQSSQVTQELCIFTMEVHVNLPTPKIWRWLLDLINFLPPANFVSLDLNALRNKSSRGTKA
jgi:hypothetical protein